MNLDSNVFDYEYPRVNPLESFLLIMLWILLSLLELKAAKKNNLKNVFWGIYRVKNRENLEKCSSEIVHPCSNGHWRSNRDWRSNKDWCSNRLCFQYLRFCQTWDSASNPRLNVNSCSNMKFVYAWTSKAVFTHL